MYANLILEGIVVRLSDLVALGEGGDDGGFEAELVVGPGTARAAGLRRVPPEGEDPGGLARADVALGPELAVVQGGGEQDGGPREHQPEAGPVGLERPGDVALPGDGQRAELARPF